MYINFYKKCFLSIMIAGVGMSNVLPMKPLAAEPEEQQELQQIVANNYSLGPAGFKDAMAQTTTSVFAMDSYAKLIRNQQETDLNKISSINNNLKLNMIQHQKDAKTNASYWLEKMRPQIMKTNQNVIDYNDVFQAHYNNLLRAIDQKDSRKLKEGLEELYSSILKNEKGVDVLLGDLKTFRNRMEKDTTSFKNDSNQLTSILASTNAGIPVLQQQINTYNDLIKKSNDTVIAGSVLCTSLIACIAGGPMIANALNEIAGAEREIANLKEKISGAQIDLVILEDINNKTTNMTNTLDTAITALQKISNQWHTVGAKYNNLLKNVKEISPEEFTFIKEDLNTARDGWKDIRDYIEKLREGVMK
ncbi:TPA: alpha-helical pore-forming toxin family protein [Bacillus thuringiensis]|nr:alpha-helical pore-forming toxin family protein [Bacillus thuringiensis]